MNRLDKVIDFFGSKTATAKALNVSPMVVYQWSKRRIPVERAIAIENATNGEIKASYLRPDIFEKH